MKWAIVDQTKLFCPGGEGGHLVKLTFFQDKTENFESCETSKNIQMMKKKALVTTI